VATVTRPPTDPVARPPARRPGSVRRTSSILMFWPGGAGTDLHLKGGARDLLTPVEGEPEVLGEADLYVVTNPLREVVSIEADPAPRDVDRLIGSRAGGNLRASIAQELPDEVAAGTPMHLLLDDLAGCTLIAGFVFMRWLDELPGFRERMQGGGGRRMQGVCSGFQPGSVALFPDGTLSGKPQNVAHPSSLNDPDDPWSWHELPDHPPMAMRRSRRIDVWAEGDVLQIDAMFRDNAWDPDGQESVVHEYHMEGSADRTSGLLRAVTAVPRVLPYNECTGAAPNASWMAGTELRAMRTAVLERLKSVDCCTHLNDGLRSLAEVPILAASLPD
jgi:hypothetical protein